MKQIKEFRSEGVLCQRYMELGDKAIPEIVDYLEEIEQEWESITPIDTWQSHKDELETVIWHDFRTGEQLYRNKRTGQIVNAAGKEVPCSWWE